MGFLIETPENETTFREEGRLDDLTINNNSYGSYLPKAYGRVRLPGHLLWAEPLREEVRVNEERTSFGKGKKRSSQAIVVTSYFYYATFFVAFASSHAKNINKLWFDTYFVNDINELDLDYEFYSGSETQVVGKTLVKPSVPVGAFNIGFQVDRPSPNYKGVCGILFKDLPLQAFGNRIPAIEAELYCIPETAEEMQYDINRVLVSGTDLQLERQVVETKPERIMPNVPDPISISVIISDLCKEAGLEEDEIDTTDIDDIIIDGFFTNDSTIADNLQILFDLYSIDVNEKNGILYFESFLTGVTDVTAFAEDLSEDYEEQEIPQLNLPTITTLTFQDINADLQTATVEARRIQNPISVVEISNREDRAINVAGAKHIIRGLLFEILSNAWSRRLVYKGISPTRYMFLTPGDIITFNYGTFQANIKISEMNISPNFEVEIIGYALFDTNLTSSQNISPRVEDPTVEPPMTPTIFTGFSPSILQILDIPYLQDSEVRANPRFIVGVRTEDVTKWKGSNIYTSIEEDDMYRILQYMSKTYSYGVLVENVDLPTSFWRFDRENEIIIDVTSGFDNFESATELEVLQGANTLVIGEGSNSFELIQFQKVEALSDTRLKLSKLLRGRRGTEVNAKVYNIGQRVTLINPTTFAIANLIISQIFTNLFYKAVSRSISDDIQKAATVQYTGVHEDLKPYAPVQHKAELNADSTMVKLSWVRRTRYNGELMPLTGEVPLNEESEKYEVDVVQNDGSIVTHKDITEPMLSIQNSNLSNPLVYTVYQVSNIVGRGFGASVTRTL